MAAELQRFRKEYVQPVQLRYHGRPVSLGLEGGGGFSVDSLIASALLDGSACVPL